MKKAIFFWAIYFFNIMPARAGIITDAPKIKEVALNALVFLLSIAGILAIISIMISGMMYFFSAGDLKIEEKAKKGLWFSIAGTIVVFGALVIIKVIQGFIDL